MSTETRTFPTSYPPEFSAQAAGFLDEVRHAVERNRLEGARKATLHLLRLLTPPDETEPVIVRGGLAPWQKRKVEAYLSSHLERGVRVEELAAEARLSVSHFCRAFKQTFGDTPHAHIIRLRLGLAKTRMLATEEPLSQIALACGFADQAHFNKLFRRLMGETPGMWRRRNILMERAQTPLRQMIGGHQASL